ncbi:hypothetical protein [Nonlabens ulvanivorans]|uniref:Uncharacterized protein n=1 Tax=Nonlabens ulvanivorans TaxID=906888 RepID=A0A084JUB9_NONUL|nr:hypothetical protein [Nonlabens ulvanivorans]KEZ92553.1 hypothetical protein IL45_10415 [Nonlabens ulvanivorans]PRX15391.1 hypothetical protein LY02_00608 [Nonlabens ulvanivorans]
MKKTITILTMSLCSIMAFSQIAPEVIVSKPVEVKKSTNQIAYGTEDDQGNTIVLMNNFEGGVQFMAKLDENMNVIKADAIKASRKENAISSIKVDDGNLVAIVDTGESFETASFNTAKNEFDMPKFKTYKIKVNPYKTDYSPNKSILLKTNRQGKYNKTGKDKRTFIIGDKDGNVLETKTHTGELPQMLYEDFYFHISSPGILDDGTVIMQTLPHWVKKKEGKASRKNRSVQKNLPREIKFYFFPPNSDKASETLYLGSDSRAIVSSNYVSDKDHLYVVSVTEEFSFEEGVSDKSFIQVDKISFSSKKVVETNEYELAKSTDEFYINLIKTVTIDDSGAIRFVGENVNLGNFMNDAIYDNLSYAGHGDVLIGEITNNKSNFYYLDRKMKNEVIQKIKGAGSRFSTGVFSFEKNNELFVLFNSGDFSEIDKNNFTANYLDSASQKIRDKKGIGAVLKNIKSQAYIFKLGANGLEYEAIEKAYDNPLAFEKAYLNEKGEVIVATGEWDSKQFVKMKF